MPGSEARVCLRVLRVIGGAGTKGLLRVEPESD